MDIECQESRDVFYKIRNKYDDEDLAQFEKFAEMMFDMDRLYMGGCYHTVLVAILEGTDAYKRMKKEWKEE